MARYSENYLLTVTPSAVGYHRSNMKPWLDKLNKILKEEGYGYRYYITFHNRLGVKNPAWPLYRNRYNYRVKTEHAVRTDLYLVRKYLYNGMPNTDIPTSTFELLKKTLKEVAWRGNYIEV